MALRSNPIKQARALEKVCDALIQEVARLHFNGLCAFCGRRGVAGHHIVMRSVKILRHEETNVIYVCQAHHDLLHGIFTDQNEEFWPDKVDDERDIPNYLMKDRSDLKHFLHTWENRHLNKDGTSLDMLKSRKRYLTERIRGME